MVNFLLLEVIKTYFNTLGLGRSLAGLQSVQTNGQILIHGM